MNPLARQFADLRFALQELESAVQQPRDEMHSVEYILRYFPAVMTQFVRVLSDALTHSGCEPADLEDIFIQAHTRAWLKGDLGLWLHLVKEFEHFDEITPESGRGTSLAQHVRACSSMLWQTYELLTQRFRWQTQISSFGRTSVSPPASTATPVRAM